MGAISVHLVCGIWGTLAVGIFSTDYLFYIQLIGVLSYGLFSFTISFFIFYVLSKINGIRVTKEEELIGLDIGEHEMESYSGFQIFTVE